jgi:hypothetical protein
MGMEYKVVDDAGRPRVIIAGHNARFRAQQLANRFGGRIVPVTNGPVAIESINRDVLQAKMNVKVCDHPPEMVRRASEFSWCFVCNSEI